MEETKLGYDRDCAELELENLSREGESRSIRQDRNYVEIIQAPEEATCLLSTLEMKQQKFVTEIRKFGLEKSFVTDLAKCYGVAFTEEKVTFDRQVYTLFRAVCDRAVYNKWTVLRNLKHCKFSRREGLGLWDWSLKNIDALNGSGLSGLKMISPGMFRDEKISIIKVFTKCLAGYGIYVDKTALKSLPQRDATPEELQTRAEHLAWIGQPVEMAPERVLVQQYQLTLGNLSRQRGKAQQLALAMERWNDLFMDKENQELLEKRRNGTMTPAELKKWLGWNTEKRSAF